MISPARRRRVARAVAAEGVDALLVTHLPDIRYLTGFTGSSGVVVSMNTQAVLFTDGRYMTQAKAEAGGTRVLIVDKPALQTACEWVQASGAKRCGFDAEHTTVAALDRMRKALGSRASSPFFHPVASLISGLREIKDGAEILALRAAAALGCRIFDSVLHSIVPGVTETEIGLQLERHARLGGAESMSFETIVAAGVRSALPHGHASSAKLPRSGFVTLDFGVVLDGYCSDMTRTVYLGRAGAEHRSVYDSALEAQEAAIAMVRPQVACGAVDEAARRVLRRDQLDSYFVHSTGHGLGLEIHEGPRLGAKQTQLLKRGMVVTIEPGVYLPGRFGIRIEDTVLVTGTGCDILTPTTKALIEL